MTDISRRQPVSRRTLLGHGVVCVTGAATLLGSATPAAAKMAQAAAAYQASPKAGHQCDNCSLFQPPSSCQLVDGNISASGWCKFWAKKGG
jgi:hypothetical protein